MEESSSRAERRRRTEERVLEAARRIFAAEGFERATIRSIAAAARTDPGLVMRYFGSKAELFARALPSTGFDELLGGKLESEPVEFLAMLRSIATHPEAAAEIRAAMTVQQRAAADRLGGDDAMVRAGLVGAVTIGVVVARYLLELDGVRDAPAAQLQALLRPVLEALTGE